MEYTEQYKIYIGYNDSQTKEQCVTKEEFLEMLTAYFQNRGIDFSISHSIGGYIYGNGEFKSELTMVVNLIGKQNLDIMELSKGLSMFMNQEHVLVTRTTTEPRFL